MFWIDGCPQFSVSFDVGEDMVKAIHLDHTPLIVVVTDKSIIIYDQNTFLPVTRHTRTEETLEQIGNNIDVQTKQVSVNSSQSQKISTANIYVRTSKQNIIIYQAFIDYSGSLYEITSSNNDATLQIGLPSSSMGTKSILANLVKTATKHIINGGDHLPGIENIEHYENDSIDDKFGNFNVVDARLSIYRVLKISIGIKNYWLKPHSHNLIVFNSSNQKSEASDNDFPKQDNYLQIINLKNLKNEIYQLSEQDWYTTASENSKVLKFAYNSQANYFLAFNESNEVWLLYFDSNNSENNETHMKGVKILEYDEKTELIDIIFIPGTELVIFQSSSDIKSYSILNRNGDYQIHYLEEIMNTLDPKCLKIDAQNGKYITVIDKSSGYWYIYSNFGSLWFSSKSIAEDISVNGTSNRDDDFLRASQILKLPNATTLIIFNFAKNRLYYVDIASIFHDGCAPLALNKQYISSIHEQKYIRFPLKSNFKKLIMDMEVHGLSSKKSRAYTGNLKLSSNVYNQFSISFGNTLSVSTPYSSGQKDFNHVLWFNFYNHYVQSFNIIDHFWFDGFLILVNRTVENEDDIKDEIVIIDAESTRYGVAGTKKRFDTDLIVWRYGFGKEFIKTTCVEKTPESASLVILTNESGIITIELLTKNAVPEKRHPEDTDNKPSKIYISVFKTIHLEAIKNKFSLHDITQITMIERRNFLFLFNYGDLFLLRCHKATPNGTSDSTNIPKGVQMYELVKVGNKVAHFKYKVLDFGSEKRKCLVTIERSTIRIYNMKDLLTGHFETQENAEFLSLENSDLHPIIIDVEGYLPVDIQCNIEKSTKRPQSIDLVVVENSAFLKEKTAIMHSRIFRKTILNAFIQYDLEKEISLESIYKTYSPFKSFSYSLELLLSQFLLESSHDLLRPLIKLIEMTSLPELIFINCLRKVEVSYWANFFAALQTDSYSFMDRLLSKDNVELCYNYLIVYLNYKKEGEDDSQEEFALSAADKELIIKIIKLVADTGNWDWCFELCRFVKLLEPSGDLLQSIEELFR